MNEKKYIKYLIENLKKTDSIVSKSLDDYFLDKIDFQELLEGIPIVELDIMSYRTWLKSEKMNNLLDNNSPKT